MIVGLIVAIAGVVVVLTALGHIPVLWALPAIGIVVAVLIGYWMNRGSRRGGP